MHAWYGGTRGAHDERVAKLGKPASNMALTYQMHSLLTAFPEIRYCYNNKILTYGPGNMFYRPTRTVYSHLFSGEQFYMVLILLKVEAIFFDNFSFVNFFLKNRNLMRLCLLDFKIESPDYGEQQYKLSFQKYPLPTRLQWH